MAHTFCTSVTHSFHKSCDVTISAGLLSFDVEVSTPIFIQSTLGYSKPSHLQSFTFSVLFSPDHFNTTALTSHSIMSTAPHKDHCNTRMKSEAYTCEPLPMSDSNSSTIVQRTSFSESSACVGADLLYPIKSRASPFCRRKADSKQSSS